MLLSVIDFLPGGENPSIILTSGSVRLRHCDHGFEKYWFFTLGFHRYSNPQNLYLILYINKLYYNTSYNYTPQSAGPVNVEDFLLRYLLHSQPITFAAPLGRLQLDRLSARRLVNKYDLLEEVSASFPIIGYHFPERLFNYFRVIIWQCLLEAAGVTPVADSFHERYIYSFRYHCVQCSIDACLDAFLKENIVALGPLAACPESC